MTAPDRSEALQAFRTARAASLPPPPTRLASAATLPAFEVAPAPEPPRQPSTSPGDTFTVDELIREPVPTCRRMATLREDMPTRPLNVDLTPDTASSFSDRCRELRVKKKDVVEVLLRAWMEATSSGSREPV